MSKFKVGDRVAVKESPYFLRVNEKTRIIKSVATSGRGDWSVFLDNYNSDLGFFEYEIERVVPAAEFKVGDRVRATAEAAKGNVGAIIKDDGIDPRYLVRFDDWADGHGDDGREWWLDTGELESAPLTIVAGRYYKTRDGRKVGPMEPYKSFDGRHPWSGNLDRGYAGAKFSFLFRDDGENYEYRDLDIIAEWPIKTAKRGNPAATVDAIADEYGGGAKPKFKVGDRVRCIKNSDGKGDGLCGTVADVGSWLVGVDMDEPFGGHGASGRRWNFYYPDEQLIFINTPNTPAIVALIENGQPKPATEPFVHPDRGSAEAESNRLAGKHKGKEFGVYELVSSAKEVKVYLHEWQRLAMNGEKINAIRELRTMSGLGLATAKRAVEDWIDRETA